MPSMLHAESLPRDDHIDDNVVVYFSCCDVAHVIDVAPLPLWGTPVTPWTMAVVGDGDDDDGDDH